MTGGTGFLGGHLTAALRTRGHRVTVLGRDFHALTAALGPDLIPVRADLRDRAAVIAACAGAEVVYHVGARSAPWGRAADFHAINVGGTEAVIAGCRRYRVRRLVYVSSPSVVFSGGDQRLLTEAAPYPRRFASVYSLTKKLGEDRVNAAAREGLETVILRPKAMFGPGDRALLPRLIAAARAGRLPQIGDGQNEVDLTYVENVVHALLLAADAPAAAGNTYTITNDEHPRLWAVIGRVLTHLGLPARLRRVPLAVAWIVAAVLEAIAARTGQEPLLTRYSAAILARTQTYNIRAAQFDLGYTPPVPLAAGIARTLRALETVG